MDDKRIERIARVCHEANRAYCEILGDTSQMPWAASADEQRAATVKRVGAAIAGEAEPSGDVPVEQQRKDKLFRAVLDALRDDQ